MQAVRTQLLLAAVSDFPLTTSLYYTLRIQLKQAQHSVQ